MSNRPHWLNCGSHMICEGLVKACVCSSVAHMSVRYAHRDCELVELWDKWVCLCIIPRDWPAHLEVCLAR